MSGNMTRIKNNQITVQTIDYTRLVPGTLVGTNFNANLTLNSNVTILGNLSVSGNTSSINSVNTYVQDPLVVFNSGYTGSIAGYDIGFLVNRNYSSLGPYGAVNTAWVWVENDQAFEAIATSTSGNALTSLTTTGFANAKLGNTTVTSLTSTGALSASAIINTPISGSTGSFTTAIATNFSTGNAVISGGFITGLANLQTTNLTSTTSVATNLSSGNVLISGGNANGLTTLGATTGVVTNLSTANAQITSGSATTLVATNLSSGNVVLTGGYAQGLANVYATLATVTNFGAANAQITSGSATTLVATNFSTANAVITGGYAQGLANVRATEVQATNFSTGNALVTGGAVNGLTTLGATTLQATNFSTANAQITSGSATTLVATNFSTANAVITGGYATGLTSLQVTNLTSTNELATNFSTANALITGGSVNGLATLGATAGVVTNLSSGNAVIGVETVTTGRTTNFSTGNALITGGYADNFAIGANTAATGAFTTLNASGIATITNTTNSTGISTGALQVAGGASVTKDLWVGGNLYAGNILGTTQSILTIQEPLLYLTGNLNGGYAYDIGFYSHFIGGPANKYAHTGLVRNYIDNDWYLFSNVGEPSGNVVNLADTNLIYDTLKLGTLLAQNTTPATSTTSGALQVAGGAGIVGNLYVGGVSAFTGNITAGNITVTGNINITGATNIISGNSGSFFGNAAGFGALYSGISSGFVFQPQTVIQSSANFNGYAQNNIQNINSGSQSTGDFVVTADTGTASTNYIDMGMASSGYVNTSPNNSLGTSLFPLDGYLYVQSNVAGSPGGNLTVGTTVPGTAVKVLVGGIDSTNITATFTTLGFKVNSATASSSTTSGALQVAGGAGIAGQLYAAGLNATTGGITTLVATNLSSANAVVTSLGATTTVSTNLSSGNAVITNAGFTTAVSTNFSTSNVQITSGSATTLVATNFSSGNAVISGGSIDSTPIGATTASSAKLTTLTTSGASTLGGNVVITSGVDVTTNSGIGALIVTGSGGASIGSNVSVGNNLYVGGASSFGQSLAVAGIVVAKSGAQYAQIALKNTNSTGSADYAAYGDTGSDAGGWVDMGVAGSAFADPAYSITKAQDGYLITRPTGATAGGNLVLATSEAGSYNDVVIGVGSFYSNSEVARFHGNVSNSGYLNLAYTTNASPAANTGALRVQGGASFASNVYHGGATIMNGSKTAGYDTIIKGKNDDTLIWARPNATYDTVIIGNSATSSTVINGAKLSINSTDTMMLPVGTTAQRPSNTGYSDVAGMLRYSTTVGAIEWFNGTGWVSASTQFTVIVDNQFNGDGGTVGFTLTQAGTTAATVVSINGVVQIPTTAYSVSGTTLTFTEAPAIGDVIDVRILTTTSTVTSLSSATGKAQILVDDAAGITFESGNGALPVFSMPIGGGLVSLDANVSVASANTPTTIDSFSTTTYRSAKYIVQITNGTNFQTQEALVVHNGTTPTIVTYGVVQTNGNLGVVSASISGGTVSVQFTAANATNTVRISREYLQL